MITVTKRLISMLLTLSVMLTLFSGCDFLTGSTGNPILSSEDYTELVQTREKVTPDEPLTLYFNGVKAIYEETKNAYFYTVNTTDVWERLIPTAEGYTVAFVTAFESVAKPTFLEQNRPASMIAYTDTDYVLFSAYFTNLPLLSIETLTLPEKYVYFDKDEEQDVYYDDEGEPIPYDPYAPPPSEKADAPIGVYDTFIELTLLDVNAAEHGYDMGFTSLARAHIRGRSSRMYPKSNYKIELLEDDGTGTLIERDATILGMRSDGDWNLNGMYAEPTKIRDKMATDLWLNITADRTAMGESTGYQCEYIEVIINNRYHGLYLITERIDQKQLGLTENDYMYFSEGDLGKWYTDFLECENDDMVVSGYSLDWPKIRTEPYDEWVQFAEFTRIMDGNKENFENAAPSLVNEESLADYEVFIQTASAVDNLIQNTFYVARQQADGSYEFTFVPWDMDQTYGNRWHGEKPLYTGLDYRSLERTKLSFWVSDKMRARNTNGYRDLVEERYAQLRETVISDKALTAMVDDTFATVEGSGAWLRNKVRWDAGGYDADIDTLKQFIVSHMEYLDSQYWQ